MISCCLCFKLRRACIVIGIIDMVLYSLILVTNCIQLDIMKRELSKRDLIQDIDSWNEDFNFSANVIGVVDSVLGICVCVALVIGTIKRKPGLILPWLIAAILSVVYYLIAKVLFVGSDGFTLHNAVFLFRILLAVFFFAVVYRFFKEVLTERQRSSSLIVDS